MSLQKREKRMLKVTKSTLRAQLRNDQSFEFIHSTRTALAQTRSTSNFNTLGLDRKLVMHIYIIWRDFSCVQNIAKGQLLRRFHQAYMIKFRAWSRGRTPRTLVNKDTSGRPSTNKDVASKPRHITRTQCSTHGDVRSKTRQVMKSASRWHLAQRTTTPCEYKKAPKLRYTLSSQASIGFVDNLWKYHA
jgi:hypothetical protein